MSLNDAMVKNVSVASLDIEIPAPFCYFLNEAWTTDLFDDVNGEYAHVALNELVHSLRTAWYRSNGSPLMTAKVSVFHASIAMAALLDLDSDNSETRFICQTFGGILRALLTDMSHSATMGLGHLMRERYGHDNAFMDEDHMFAIVENFGSKESIAEMLKSKSRVWREIGVKVMGELKQPLDTGMEASV